MFFQSKIRQPLHAIFSNNKFYLIISFSCIALQSQGAAFRQMKKVFVRAEIASLHRRCVNARFVSVGSNDNLKVLYVNKSQTAKDII